MTTHVAMPEVVQQWQEIAQQLRVDSVRASAAAESGHPTSSLSAADLMAVLMAKYLHYDFENPDDPNNDHLIFSKGHASPLLYSMFKVAGVIEDEELLTFRQTGSRLEGHPTPVAPWVNVATGSLGQGLPIGMGIALAGKRLEYMPYRVWVLCGDSEMTEGSMWEAFEHAGHFQLDNLTAIIDVNRFGQRGTTMHQWDLEAFVKPAEAFGWNTIVIDGHDLEAIDQAYGEARGTPGRPTVIVAKTLKGKGVSEAEDTKLHGKPLSDAETAIEELGGTTSVSFNVNKPVTADEPHRFEVAGSEVPTYEVGDQVATRQAYGEALAALGSARPEVVGLDAEISNSTHAELFKAAHPERFIEMYIAEQLMAATCVGLQVRGWVPFASTFACFLTRAYDFIRMAAISRADINFCGSHAGVSIGEDGPSQMGLEDIAMFRAVHGSTVLHPSDANQTAQLVWQMADRGGIRYMRTMRPSSIPVLYGPDESFEIGGSNVPRQSDEDQVTIVGCGITVHEALEAAETLEGEGIHARVVDCYSIKPIDAEGLLEAGRATGRIITVEDHWPEGGLGDAVLEVFADADVAPRIVKMAVRDMPSSGPTADMLRDAGIDAEAIAERARKLVQAPPREPVEHAQPVEL
ncbi:MAG: transketolase [Actinomycetota bacterium]|nr:transketolase [Actinomycetota bacterium]